MKVEQTKSVFLDACLFSDVAHPYYLPLQSVQCILCAD
jgi:hypothetical protein